MATSPARGARPDVLERLKALLQARGPRLLALTQRVFLAIALCAIGYYLFRHADQLAALLSRRVLLHCLACAALLAVLHPLIGIAFFQLQRFAGIRIDLLTSLGVYMRRIPARYVPGGIWHAVSRYADMKFDAGVSGAALRRLFVLEMALVATSGLLICGAGLWTLPVQSTAWLFAAAQFALGAVVALVAVLVAWRRAWKRLGLAAFLFLLIWSATAASFVIVAVALADDATACAAAALGSVYLIAAVQGYVAVFAPQGWGVAEASFVLLNTCGIALPGVLGAFVLFRLSAMLGDVLSYAVWAVLVRRLRSGPDAPVRND